MKKTVLMFFTCMTAVLFSAKEASKIDIRKYHLPLEEKVFEIEKGGEKSLLEEEAFEMGKKRIEDLKKNEKELLNLEEKAGIDRSRELAEFEIKYEKILEEYLKTRSERELIILENKNYNEQLERINKLENNLKK